MFMGCYMGTGRGSTCRGHGSRGFSGQYELVATYPGRGIFMFGRVFLRRGHC